MSNKLNWKDIYIWDENNQVIKVDTIEQALGPRKDGLYHDGCYVVCEGKAADGDNKTEMYGVCSGYGVEEAVYKAEDYLCSDASVSLYPATRALFCAVEHVCSVECKFNGQLAELDDDFYIKNHISGLKNTIQRYGLKSPTITVYAPEDRDIEQLYYPLLYVKDKSYLLPESREELEILEHEMAIQTKIFIKVADNEQVLLFEFVLFSSYEKNPYECVYTNHDNFSYFKTGLVRYNASHFLEKIFFDEEFKEHYYITLAPELLNSFNSDNFYFLHPIK